MGGFNFRLGTYNVPEGPSDNPYVEGRSPEFDGTDGTGGTDGTDWTGWTVDQKSPLKIFILCGYIDKIYAYLYTK